MHALMLAYTGVAERCAVMYSDQAAGSLKAGVRLEYHCHPGPIGQAPRTHVIADLKAVLLPLRGVASH